MLYKKTCLIAFILVLSGFVLLLYSLIDLHSQSTKAKNALKQAKLEIEQNKPDDINVPSNERAINPKFKTGDIIGILNIPKLKDDLAIIEGTSEDELEKGVGHYKKTCLPGESDQILLSGHRDTVFRKLGELKVGDMMLD